MVEWMRLPAHGYTAHVERLVAEAVSDQPPAQASRRFDRMTGEQGQAQMSLPLLTHFPFMRRKLGFRVELLLSYVLLAASASATSRFALTFQMGRAPVCHCLDNG